MEIRLIRFANPEEIPDVGIGTIDDRIIKAAHSRNVAIISQTIFPLLSEEKDLQWLERKFRQYNTPVYILAAPAKVYPPKAMSLLLGKPKRYFSWFVVNGEQEAKVTLAEFGLAKDYDENFKLLKDVGFYTVNE